MRQHSSPQNCVSRYTLFTHHAHNYTDCRVCQNDVDCLQHLHQGQQDLQYETVLPLKIVPRLYVCLCTAHQRAGSQFTW